MPHVQLHSSIRPQLHTWPDPDGRALKLRHWEKERKGRGRKKRESERKREGGREEKRKKCPSPEGQMQVMTLNMRHLRLKITK